MAIREFLLPDLGEGLEDAEIVAWHVTEGDEVELNQTLVEVNTAKALVEIPSPWDGVVSELHAADGDVVKVGAPLVSIDVAAHEGRVPRDDVLEVARTAGVPASVAGPASAATTVAAGDVQRIPVRGTRRLIAEKMARSAREIPHVTTFLTVDATHVLAFRAEIERDSGERVTPLAIVVRVLVETCAEHPKLNATFNQDQPEILLHGSVHVGIATDTQHGLLAPVIRGAEDRGILDIAAEIRRLAEA